MIKLKTPNNFIFSIDNEEQCAIHLKIDNI